MASIKGYLTQDHRDIDEFFTNLENKVNEDIENANDEFEKFTFELEKHLQMEEKVMFLEFEQATGMTQGPTQMMRMEHNQMRELILVMKNAIENKDKQAFFSVSETLMMLMQQHNMKEEQMLYTMAEQHLAPQSDRILDMMQSIVVDKA